MPQDCHSGCEGGERAGAAPIARSIVRSRRRPRREFPGWGARIFLRRRHGRAKVLAMKKQMSAIFSEEDHARLSELRRANPEKNLATRWQKIQEARPDVAAQ